MVSKSIQQQLQVLQIEQKPAKNVAPKVQTRKPNQTKAPQVEPLPKLIVLDLDNTVWTPELFQLRSSKPPVAWKDVRLFPAAATILQDIANGGKDGRWTANGTRVAIASRTHKTAWARSLLQQFEVSPGLTIQDLVGRQDLIIIQQGSKLEHFKRLRQTTGLDYTDMLFFDDALTGKYGNCEPVARDLGVLCAHCPRGLTIEIWEDALAAFADAKRSGDAERFRAVVSEKTGVRQVGYNAGRQTAPADETLKSVTGSVKVWNEEKGFGFISLDSSVDSTGDLFTHRSALGGGLTGDTVQLGMAVRVQVGFDGKTGRRCATLVEPAGAAAISTPSAPRKWSTSSTEDASQPADGTAELPCLSLCQPFAALLLNGIKTIETRNQELLKPYAGQDVLIHIGMRRWPDDIGWRTQLAAAGYSDQEMDKLAALPSSVSKGSIAGVIKLGETMPSASLARISPGGWPTVERGVIASKEDMGKYATVVESARWLPKGSIKAKGQPAVFSVQIPLSALP